jgi:hypothetical protein
LELEIVSTDEVKVVALAALEHNNTTLTTTGKHVFLMMSLLVLVLRPMFFITAFFMPPPDVPRSSFLSSAVRGVTRSKEVAAIGVPKPEVRNNTGGGSRVPESARALEALLGMSRKLLNL